MVIYKTTNLINGKFYIGQDINDNPNYFGSGDNIKKAIKKYGKHNFKKEILERCETQELLNAREIFWIAELNAREDGYNICIGGTGGPHFSGHTHSAETKLKMKSAWDLRKKDPNFVHNMTGFKHSEETKAKYSEDRKGKLLGEKNGMYGKTHTPEARLLMSNPKYGSDNGMYGKTHSEETKRKISDKLVGKLNPFYGKKHTEETKLKMSKAAKIRSESRKSIILVDGKEFAGLEEVATHFNISVSTVRYRCKVDSFPNWVKKK